MNKRFSITDYLLSLLLLAALIGSLGAFFLGVKIGRERTAEQYEKLLTELRASTHQLAAYHQEYLVSFYHTIYLPYREFQNKWFEHLEALELHSAPINPQDAFKELSDLAGQKFKAIEDMSMPESSPLLVEAHNNYLRSLKLFKDAASGFSGKARSLRGSELIAAVEADPLFNEAKQYGLAAQQHYFEAIVEWLKRSAPELAVNVAFGEDLSFAEWAKMGLVQKSAFIAAAMSESGYYHPFTPQDLAIRVDEMIANGQADKMAFTSVNPLVAALVETGAVRNGDYAKGRQKYYAGDPLPQLPFFFE